MNKEEVLELIQEKVYNTGGIHQVLINTDNGIPNVEELEESKRNYLSFLMTHMQDDLIKTKKNYPKHDKMVVDLKADFIVINRSDFDKIIEFIDNE